LSYGEHVAASALDRIRANARGFGSAGTVVQDAINVLADNLSRLLHHLANVAVTHDPFRRSGEEITVDFTNTK
jgi:hypothetical protein